MEDKAKFEKVLEGIPNLLKLHHDLLEKSKLIRQAFGLKIFKYQLISDKFGNYSLAENFEKTSKYILKNVRPAEIKRYVKSNEIDYNDIYEAYLLFDHVSMDKYKKYDDLIQKQKDAIKNVEQLERSIHYKIADYYIEVLQKGPRNFDYQLISKDDNKLIIQGSKQEMVNKIVEEGINPDYIYKVELLKHLFK